MHGKFLRISLFGAMLVSTACVSTNESITAESDLEKCHTQMAQMEDKLMTSEEIRNKCFKDLSNLQTQHGYLKNINKQLSQNNQKLQRDLQKQRSVIVLQEKVIQVLDDTKRTIESSLKDQIAATNIEVVETKDQLKMVLVDTILFESGSTQLSKKGKALLHIIAKTIKDYENQNVVVKGHTDNKPISTRLRKNFPSNWELSAARASAVVRFLQHQGAVEPQRLSVQGYSYYQPVASNKTEKGRRKNRRIEIILSLQK